MSEDIIRATIEPVDPASFQLLAVRICEMAAQRVLNLYRHNCKYCSNPVILSAVSVAAAKDELEPLELRYTCKCRDGLIREAPGGSAYYQCFDKRLDSEGVWWPDLDLAYPNGAPFIKRERYEKYRDLFTPRNLLALAYIWDSIENGDWSRRESFLLATLFRSIVHLCSRVSGDRRVRPLSAGWTQHSFWFAKNPVEINAWGAFYRKLHEYSGVIRSWQVITAGRSFRVGKTIDEVFRKRADIFVCTQDCATFLREIHESGHRVDYVFTDPPYNGMIQYGELSTMWNAWRPSKDFDSYIASIARSELTENRNQGKNIQDYYQHLRGALGQIAEVTRPGGYVHVTFSSPKVKYRNFTLRAARLAGLSFEKLHFQRSVRSSKKSIDQPFGSIFGDFIFRFRKPSSTSLPPDRRRLSMAELVHERVEYILKHRGEATPIHIAAAECERELFNAGFFDDDKALNRDVVDAMKRDESFRVSRDGSVTFACETRFTGTPLSLRVEKTVRERLAESRVVTYTDIWSAVLKEYPNSLTPDSTSITRSLQKYAIQKAGGVWEVKPAALRDRSTVHNRIILHCAKAFLAAGYEIAIGRPERSDAIFHSLRGRYSDICALIEIGSEKRTRLADHDRRRIANIDLAAWKIGDGLLPEVFLVEVETSTGFIDAFDRAQALLRSPKLDVTIAMMVTDRLRELQGRIGNRTTFRSVPDDIKRRTRVVAFDPGELTSLRKWKTLSQLIRRSPTWADLEAATRAVT
jgi:hypothetical protein